MAKIYGKKWENLIATNLGKMVIKKAKIINKIKYKILLNL